jgi:hypothetical protein
MESTLEVSKSGGMLCCLNEEGDKRIMWNSNDDTEVTEAAKVFAEFKARGYLAYKTDGKGQRGSVIDKFDASAERIIMQPQMVGG